MHYTTKHLGTGRKSPHQSLIEGGETFRYALPPHHHLPYGWKVAISRYSARKAKVEEKKRGDFTRGRYQVGGEGSSPTTPAAATPCSVVAEAWMVASNRPSAPRTVSA